MKINELQKAQVAAIKTLLPELKTCEEHGGRFDLSELAGLSAKTPALFVACLSIKGVSENGDETVALNNQFAAFIVTTDKKGLTRSAAGKNIAEALSGWLPNQRFDLQGVGVPKSISASNLYSGKARSKAVALWAVTWQQELDVGESAFPDGVLPENLYVGGELQEEL